MSNWQTVTLPPYEPGDTEIKLQRLPTACADLDVMQLEDGRFYVEAVHSCDGETFIGHADTLAEGQQMAERWLLAEIANMLKSIGADGIWLVRGADYAVLDFAIIDGEGDDEVTVRLESPHERILLARFAAGDGEPGGIEYF